MRSKEQFAVEDRHDGGLQCRRCKNYTCNICIKSFIALLNTKLRCIAYDLFKKDLFKDMIRYLQEKERSEQKIQCFTDRGPCCTIIRIDSDLAYDIEFDNDDSREYNKELHDQQQTEEELTTNKFTENNTNTNEKSTKDTTSNEHVFCPPKKPCRNNSRKTTRNTMWTNKINESRNKHFIDGALHIPQHHLLVHLPIGIPSTHAMGDQKTKNEKGLVHACVDPVIASTISEVEFKSTKKKTSIIRSYVTTTEVTDTNGVKTQKRTWWVELAIDRTVQPKKHSNPSKADILQSSFIELPEGYDCYGILGEPYNSDAYYHLIQLSFHGKSDLLPMIREDMDSLYNDLLKRAGNKGLEASRTGGSQGFCTNNKLFKDHLRRAGSFPRNANAMVIIILNSKRRCGYFGVYSCPYEQDGRVKTWFYNTPRVGGHQKLLHRQLQKFPFLTQFPSCRVETAQLLHHRNNTMKHRLACPKSIESMIGEWNDAVGKQRIDQYKHSQGYYLARDCRLTLLSHPVGYHRDSFAHNRGDKIENKILLISQHRSNKKSTIAMGRGGCGPGVFVYALLDW